MAPIIRRLGTPNSTGGFTLVELLVAMGLMAIISAILATILFSAQTMYDSATSVARLTAESRSALDRIGKDFNRIELTTSGAVVDTAIQRLGLWLRSKPMVPENMWGTQQEMQQYAPFHTNPPASPSAEASQNAILSFYAQPQYFVDDGNGQLRTVVSSARVLYYMMARTDDMQNPLPGAFLIRRIEPFEAEPHPVIPNTWTFNWGDPVEDDICSFVRGAQVYYLDRRNIAPGTDQRFIEARAGVVPPPDPILLDAPNNRLEFRLDPLWNTTNLALPFTQKDFLPPAIMIEMFIIDESGSTFREIRRVYNFEMSPSALPAKPR